MALDAEQVVRHAYQVAEKKDVPGWIALFTEDGTFTDNSIGVTYRGQALGDTVEAYATAFPDMHRELYEVYVTGNIVVVQLALQGTPPRPFGYSDGSHPADREVDGRALLRRLRDPEREDQTI